MGKSLYVLIGGAVGLLAAFAVAQTTMAPIGLEEPQQEVYGCPESQPNCE